MTATYIEFRNQLTAHAPPQLVFGVAQQPDDQPNLFPWRLQSATPPIARFDAQSIDPDNPGIFRETGESIFTELSQDPNFQIFYNGTIAAPIGSADRMVLVKCQSESLAHAFPWEALHDQQGFAALHRQLPFARLVKSKKAPTQAAFDGRLRLVAVIGAVGEPSGPEWTALQGALAAWNGGVDALVLVDSLALVGTVTTAALPGVTAELTPQFPDELVLRIGQHLPHVVHIFCHGNPDGGGQLEIAHTQTALGVKPLTIGAGELAPALASAWLVTLNACGSGGAAESGSSSFACTLVEQGVPCVVGMRQRIGADVANAFTGAFLSGALAEFDRAWTSGAETWTPQFGPALTSARSRIVATIGLSQVNAGEKKAWTLPIMCVAANPLRIALRKRADPASIRREAQIAELREILTRPDLDPIVRAGIEHRIAELSAEAAD